MTTFKTFLEAKISPYVSSKPPVKDNDYKGILELISKNYSDAWDAFITRDRAIWRGHNNSNEKVMISHPSTGTRKSENTVNYYTILIDNNPHWSDYPKRSKSFIGHTSFDRALEYESDKRSLCLLLPKNGSKIAICPEYDIWDVKVPLLNREIQLGDIYDALDDYVYSELKDDTLEGLKTAMGYGGVTDIIQYYTKGDKKLDISFYDFKKGRYDIDKLFNYIFDSWAPKALGFSLITTTQLSKLPDSQEVWTDGECLVLDSDYVFNELKEYYDNH